MRRKDREITDKNEIVRGLGKYKICRIAMKDEKEVYVVPMNFGYTYEKGKLTLFFHSAKEGRKIGILKKSKDVCFEMDYDYGLIEGEVACEYGYGFESIIGYGRVIFIEDSEEKIKALNEIMKQQTGKEFQIDGKMAEKVCVFKLEAESFAGKKRSI